MSVSYTHLDVYKRQLLNNAGEIRGSRIFGPVAVSYTHLDVYKRQDKLSNGLAKLAEEDPTFTVKTDEQTGQTVISGMANHSLQTLYS